MVLCFCTFTVETGQVRGLEHQKGGCKEGLLVRSSILGKNKGLEKQVKIMEGVMILELSELHRNKFQRLPRDASQWDLQLLTEQLHSFCQILLTAADSSPGKESEVK